MDLPPVKRPLNEKIYRWKAFTISPPYATIRVTDLHERYKNIITPFLRRCSKAWVCYPELSSDARLHYHGALQVDDEIAFMKGYHKLRSIGIVMFKPLRTQRDKISWILYCKKDGGLTAPLLFPHSYPMTPTKPKRSKRSDWTTPAKADILTHFTRSGDLPVKDGNTKKVAGMGYCDGCEHTLLVFH